MHPQSPAVQKPRLRGVLHAAAMPLAVIAGLALVVVGPTPTARIGAAVFTAAAGVLFGVSALYHRGRWTEQTRALLRRLDHSNIFLLIAGTFTPFALLALSGTTRTAMLWVVWLGAIGGIALSVFLPGAPRVLTTLFYVALGWVAVAVLPQLWRGGGAVAVLLTAAGGVLYTMGAVVYATRRPDPSPRWFGYHEVFHAFTVAAFGCHWLAVLAVTVP